MILKFEEFNLNESKDNKVKVSNLFGEEIWTSYDKAKYEEDKLTFTFSNDNKLVIYYELGELLVKSAIFGSISEDKKVAEKLYNFVKQYINDKNITDEWLNDLSVSDFNIN